MTDTTEAITKGLRAWTRNHDAYVRAAVDLLIEQDHWLWDEDFAAACIQRDDAGVTWLSWPHAMAYLESGPPCSDGEAAILRVAIDLGSGRWHIDRLDARNRARVADAVRQAVGL